jgi:biotin synthase
MAGSFCESLAQAALGDAPLASEHAERILTDSTLDALDLAHAAYRVRRQHWGKGVMVHIINNAQNGHCPEDCSYCSQAKTSEVDIDKYPIKSEAEVLSEARRAYEAGAARYCMVFAGRGPNARRTETLARLVRQIKASYNIEVCVSAGLLDEEKARLLKSAGVDRYNHNLNTSRDNYPKICGTHTYDDRLGTIRAARNQGLSVCSGVIVGLGESPSELVELAAALRELEAESIPVNFLLPFEGTPLQPPKHLTAEFCLRVLCLFRLTNPRAELRVSAGREVYLGALQPLALMPANSLFLDGYLNSRGEAARNTLQMIRDAGFHIVSDMDLDELLKRPPPVEPPEQLIPLNSLKTRAELRPSLDR